MLLHRKPWNDLGYEDWYSTTYTKVRNVHPLHVQVDTIGSSGIKSRSALVSGGPSVVAEGASQSSNTQSTTTDENRTYKVLGNVCQLECGAEDVRSPFQVLQASVVENAQVCVDSSQQFSFLCQLDRSCFLTNLNMRYRRQWWCIPSTYSFVLGITVGGTSGTRLWEKNAQKTVEGPLFGASLREIHHSSTLVFISFYASADFPPGACGRRHASWARRRGSPRVFRRGGRRHWGRLQRWKRQVSRHFIDCEVFCTLYSTLNNIIPLVFFVLMLLFAQKQPRVIWLIKGVHNTITSFLWPYCLENSANSRGIMDFCVKNLCSLAKLVLTRFSLF